MPRKRKDNEETGIKGTKLDTPGEETAAKIVSPSAKPPTRDLQRVRILFVSVRSLKSAARFLFSSSKSMPVMLASSFT